MNVAAAVASIEGGAPSEPPARRRRYAYNTLLQAEAFVHEALKARAIDDVVGKFFIREHGQGGAACVSSHLGGLFHRELRILANNRHHHTHHHLQAAKAAWLVFVIVTAFVYSPWLFCMRIFLLMLGPSNVHTAP